METTFTKYFNSWLPVSQALQLRLQSVSMKSRRDSQKPFWAQKAQALLVSRQFGSSVLFVVFAVEMLKSGDNRVDQSSNFYPYWRDLYICFMSFSKAQREEHKAPHEKKNLPWFDEGEMFPLMVTRPPVWALLTARLCRFSDSWLEFPVDRSSLLARREHQ